MGNKFHEDENEWMGLFLFMKIYYRKMMINQDTACMFACCYDNKGGHLPAHSAKPAIFQQVRVGTDFASFFSREREGKISSTLVLADMACWAGTARVSNFIIITSGKHAAPVFVYHHLPVSSHLFFRLSGLVSKIACEL